MVINVKSNSDWERFWPRARETATYVLKKRTQNDDFVKIQKILTIKKVPKIPYEKLCKGYKKSDFCPLGEKTRKILCVLESG